ncbi:hypothetical protein [Candidatus Spongiisocius sp.]|uniref:hypothetical protein n=1 Tax=Candidatus Spongiisocius sp. TaxID=3101273 RepID=UPI003B5C3A6F
MVDGRPETEAMFGSELAFSPEVVLAMWAAGVAGSGAAVAYWRIVGRGYLWLVAATVVLIGGGAWYFDPGALAAAAVLLGAGAALVARNSRAATVTLGLSSLSFLVGAAAGSPVPAITGSAALGGITGEMLLGHWFLVSPRMPRWPLRALAVVGGAAVALDWLVHFAPGLPPAPSAVPLIASVALAATSVVLMAAVWFALGYPSYPGVMAATGLSYLAVLTSLGSVILIRALAAGVSPL